MDTENYTVINNDQQLQFEIYLEGEIALLQYRFYKGDIALMHTLVPEKISGKGLASALAHQALEWAKEHQKKVRVYCPFVADYLKRHPEYYEIINKHYQ